ncbi:response regulator [Bosea sp. 124]|uniref:response regulator transcription factor n=1 Tax=Bosea sp. 124 TaxID=2135642 RepID=UPI000D378482|nr:response regulator [Bosea sp. 124]PTM39524.1 LuxR family two component transcriptional regulator [Bosea sp. 124]
MSSDAALVFVIDDNPAMRASLESLLRSVGHDVESFHSSQDFLANEPHDGAACLVLDVRLPGASGLEFQRELTRLGRGLPVIFITGHGDVQMSVAAMKAGAIEFLTKPFRDQDLLDAVHRGLTLDLERHCRLKEIDALRKRFETLTPREREILPLVASGLMNKQIAASLQLSEITVKVHRAQVMQKLQATSLADLVRISDRIAETVTGAAG